MVVKRGKNLRAWLNRHREAQKNTPEMLSKAMVKGEAERLSKRAAGNPKRVAKSNQNLPARA
jgi:hypothetical protein